MTDSGPGVPSSRRRAIFEEYEQAHTTSITTGTGLGLPLCKELVGLMGSVIRLDCPPAGGSVFSFELRMPQHVGSGGGAVAQPKAEEAPLPSGLCVLLADDSAVNRKILQRQLEGLLRAPVCTCAQTGEEALELLRTRAFDLAILDDIYSQGWAAAGAAERILTGLDVTREVRWAGITSRSGGALPIIGATGKECESHNTQAIEAGQCVVWGKPSPGREEMERDLRLALSDVLSGRASGPRQG